MVLFFSNFESYGFIFFRFWARGFIFFRFPGPKSCSNLNQTFSFSPLEIAFWMLKTPIFFRLRRAKFQGWGFIFFKNFRYGFIFFRFRLESDFPLLFFSDFSWKMSLMVRPHAIDFLFRVRTLLIFGIKNTFRTLLFRTLPAAGGKFRGYWTILAGYSFDFLFEISLLRCSTMKNSYLFSAQKAATLFGYIPTTNTWEKTVRRPTNDDFERGRMCEIWCAKFDVRTYYLFLEGRPDAKQDINCMRPY